GLAAPSPPPAFTVPALPRDGPPVPPEKRTINVPLPSTPPAPPAAFPPPLLVGPPLPLIAVHDPNEVSPPAEPTFAVAPPPPPPPPTIRTRMRTPPVDGV